MVKLNFDPPLINSSGPWATTYADLENLYRCKSTGAITTRTSTLQGFAHDDTIHQHAFFDIGSLGIVSAGPALTSLNTLGYSPIPLKTTLSNVVRLVKSNPEIKLKPVIISITGTPNDMCEAFKLVIAAKSDIPSTPILVEINLSCPNIHGQPPPSYSQDGIAQYLKKLPLSSDLKFGIKLPPFSNPENFVALEKALLELSKSSLMSKAQLPLNFITTTNTLGCSYLPSEMANEPLVASADGTGIGGLAGAALHPLSLGNVKLLRTLLDRNDGLNSIEIIGIGGVSSRGGFDRMKNVGARVVGVGTALGVKGVNIFSKIWINQQD